MHVVANRREERDSIWASFVAMEQGKNVTEHRFMREYVWCVHVSGFSAKVVSKLIGPLLEAHGVESPDGSYIEIRPENLLSLPQVEERVYPINKNKAKARAIQKVRKIILDTTWEKFKSHFLSGGPAPKDLQGLPFLGPALSCHMARNLGNLNVAKPDIHMTRLAANFGLPSVDALCRACVTISAGSGTGQIQEINLGGRISIGYVDLTLWLASVDCGTH